MNESLTNNISHRNLNLGNWTLKKVLRRPKYSKIKPPNSRSKEDMNWPSKYSKRPTIIYRIVPVSIALDRWLMAEIIFMCSYYCALQLQKPMAVKMSRSKWKQPFSLISHCVNWSWKIIWRPERRYVFA